jgi:aspartate aminotransferase-like enzyme
VQPIKKYLFTPGPTQVPPDVLLEIARPIIHHRTPEFSAQLDLARERLKPLFGTNQEVLVLASSGTGAMEAAVCNLLEPGDEAIFINGGKFGERWGKLLTAHAMVAREVKVEWGRAVDPGQVEEAIHRYPRARAVLVQASETSTTAIHPVEQLGQITRKRDVLLIVDGVTSVGVYEQKMDEWAVDALVTGSQKALMLPPGLGMIALSERAWERARAVKTPRYYFDLTRELKAQRDEHTTAYTPAVGLVGGLNKSLELIHKESLPAVFARHRMMAEVVREGARALGLKLFAVESPAPGVTGILAPEGVDAAKVVRAMRDDLGVGVQAGQDHMRSKLIRIGHMGYVAPFDMLVALSALELALRRHGCAVAVGAGVAAAQQRLASTV